jgi:hypothetical protein
MDETIPRQTREVLIAEIYHGLAEGAVRPDQECDYWNQFFHITSFFWVKFFLN